MSSIRKELADCYQPLFNHMLSEHHLILTTSEMDEIISLSLSVKDKTNEIVNKYAQNENENTILGMWNLPKNNTLK